MSDTEALTAGLRAWARGTYSIEAMVEVLARGVGGFWLTRSDFLDACIEIVDDHPEGPWAWLDTEQARAFLDSNPIASGGERRMLEIALSVGGHHRVDLSQALGGLSHVNIAVVLEAVAHLGGWHERYPMAMTVDGTWSAEVPVSVELEAIRSAFDRQDSNG